jgi:hypothetical protein
MMQDVYLSRGVPLFDAPTACWADVGIEFARGGFNG